MQIICIAAVAKNRVIGKDNQLVWRLPDDMKFFSKTTKGHCIVTGRKNYESIPEKYRPLPGRTNLILTRNASYNAPGAHVFNTLQDAVSFAEKQGETELYIIGGGEIYKQALEQNLVDVLLLTEVDAEPEGDTFFPVFDEHRYTKNLLETHPKDEKHDYSFSIYSYEKKQS